MNKISKIIKGGAIAAFLAVVVTGSVFAGSILEAGPERGKVTQPFDA